MRPKDIALNVGAILMSPIVFVVSFFVSEINWVNFNLTNPLFLRFINALVNSLIMLLFQWVIWHLIFCKDTIVFFNIKKNSKKIKKLIGISQRENNNLPILSKENYDQIELDINQYKEWTYPIIDFDFKVRFWWTIKPKLIYIQITQASKSFAKSTNVNYKKLDNVYEIKLLFCNKVNGFNKKMKDKSGHLILNFSNPIGPITYMRYGRDDSEKSYAGLIFCRY